MNWYLNKFIFAQNLQSFLQSIGATSEIIQFILSADKNLQPLLINILKKKPTVTLSELQQVQIPKKIDPYLDYEKREANKFPEISQWILVNCRKIRKGKMPSSDYNFWTGPEYLTEDEKETLVLFISKLDEINDWFRAIRPDISSYSAHQAVQESDEWHVMMAGKGGGKFYEPTKPENILYGPQWKNKKWDGWTIQRVTSENDLLVEGNKQNHCVGSYCDDVKSGSSIIYSLRDPKNHPHVTMELNGYRKYFTQFKANSNDEPSAENKEMIKEWMTSENNPDNIQKETAAFEMVDNEGIDLDLDSLYNLLMKIVKKEPDEYGLIYSLDKNIENIAEDALNMHDRERNAYRNRRSYDEGEYNGDITNFPYLLVNLAIQEDLKDPEKNWNKTRDFEKYLWRIGDEANESVQDWIMNSDLGLKYPQEEDFETPEEFQQAEKEYEEAESEIFNDAFKQTLKGGFASDGHKRLDWYREKKILPVELVPQKIAKKMNWYKIAQQNINQGYRANGSKWLE